MAIKRPRLDLGVRMRRSLERRHAGWIEYVEQLEPYVIANPDDRWAVGQLRYAKSEIVRLTEQLGLAVNRQDRPTS